MTRPSPGILLTALWCLLGLLLLIPTAHAAQCDEDTIRSVTNDGEIIVMQSGAVFEVMAGDTVDSALWLPVSDVMICQRALTVRGRAVSYYEIINLDDREKVSATKLR
jgi:hypothetical protein